MPWRSHCGRYFSRYHVSWLPVELGHESFLIVPNYLSSSLYFSIHPSIPRLLYSCCHILFFPRSILPSLNPIPPSSNPPSHPPFFSPSLKPILPSSLPPALPPTHPSLWNSFPNSFPNSLSNSLPKILP